MFITRNDCKMFLSNKRIGLTVPWNIVVFVNEFLLSAQLMITPICGF